MFVSSRRQTRLTALDLIGYAAGDERPRQFVHCPEPELDQAVAAVQVGYPLHGYDCRRPCPGLPWGITQCPHEHEVSDLNGAQQDECFRHKSGVNDVVEP